MADGAFGVEIVIPDSYPTKVSRFATEEAAEAWIAQNRKRVQSEILAQKWFQKTRQGR